MLRRNFSAFAFLCLTVLLATPAQAIRFDTISTFNFTGACSDCYGGDGDAFATLVLANYVPGTEILSSNLVSFDYHGTDLLGPYKIDQTNLLHIEGNIPTTLPSDAVYFFINGTIDSSAMAFETSIEPGGWWTGLPSDQGLVYSWDSTSVPEPAAFLLVGAALVAGLGLRGKSPFRL